MSGELHLQMHEGGDGYPVRHDLGGTGHTEGAGNEATKQEHGGLLFLVITLYRAREKVNKKKPRKAVLSGVW